MNRLPLLLLLTLILTSCTTRVIPAPAGPARPPADLKISVLVLTPAGTEPEPALFVVEPGGQLRAATGEGVARDVIPPRTRLLSDLQVGQLYGTILREGLALPASSPAPGEPRIEITVIVDNARTRGVHSADAPAARALVERCRELARLD